MEEEIIPNTDKLFYHIPKSIFQPYYDFDDIPLHAFTPQGNDGLSVNWEKYCSTALDCLLKKTVRHPQGRTEETHGVGHFITSDILTIDFLSVVHSPSTQNKAHSLVKGIPPKTPKTPFNQMRKELRRIFHWDIRPKDENNNI